MNEASNVQRFRSSRVVTPDGVIAADILVQDGRILDIVAQGGPVDRDFGDLVVMPGVVDVHVHINEPGRTEWEGFETATKAAAAGGTTTLVDMPLNSIPSTTTVPALQQKIAASAGKLRADVGFWGGVVPGNTEDLAPLWEAGVLGFKCFMINSGVDEFEWVRRRDLEQAMPLLAKLGAPLLAHAELAETIETAADVWIDHDPLSYATWLASRPDSAEEQAIELLTELAERHGTRIHIVHLATEVALPFLRAARERLGGQLTVETCAHYLTFAAEEIPDGQTAFKCAPPIREGHTREALWRALAAGDLQFVTTDHSPSPMSLKSPEEGRFDESWGGIASLQLLLPAVWTGAHARGHTVEELAHWVCTAPADFAGLGQRKGRLAACYDADFVVFDPDAQFEVRRDEMFHRHKYTPYEGLTLRGVVHHTYLRGVPVYDAGQFGPASGRPLLRSGDSI